MTPWLQNWFKQGGIFKCDVFQNTLIEKYKKVKFSRKGVKLRPEPPVGTLPFLNDCFTYGTYFSFVYMKWTAMYKIEVKNNFKI